MPINQELNKTLKEMWRLDEKMEREEVLSPSEQDFFNQHLSVIQEYYHAKHIYWQSKIYI